MTFWLIINLILSREYLYDNQKFFIDWQENIACWQTVAKKIPINMQLMITTNSVNKHFVNL